MTDQQEHKEEQIFGRPLSPTEIFDKEFPELSYAKTDELKVKIVEMKAEHSQELAAKDKKIEQQKKKLNNKKERKQKLTKIYGAGKTATSSALQFIPYKRLPYLMLGHWAHDFHLKYFPEDHADYHRYGGWNKEKAIERIRSQSKTIMALSWIAAGLAYTTYTYGPAVVESLDKNDEKKFLIENHIITTMQDIPCHPTIGNHELSSLNICTPQRIDGFPYQSEKFPDVKGYIKPQLINRLLKITTEKQINGQSVLYQQWLINYQNEDTPAKDSKFNVTPEDIEAHDSFCWNTVDGRKCHTGGIITEREAFYKFLTPEAE